MKKITGLVVSIATILSTSAFAEAPSARLGHLLTCEGLNDDRDLTVEVYSEVDGSEPGLESGEGALIVDERQPNGYRHFVVPSVQMDVNYLDCGGYGLSVLGSTESGRVSFQAILCQDKTRGDLVLDGEKLPVSCAPAVGN